MGIPSERVDSSCCSSSSINGVLLDELGKALRLRDFSRGELSISHVNNAVLGNAFQHTVPNV